MHTCVHHAPADASLDAGVVRAAFEYSAAFGVPLCAFLGDACATLELAPELRELHEVYYEPLAAVAPSLDALLAGPPVKKLLFMTSPALVDGQLKPHWEVRARASGREGHASAALGLGGPPLAAASEREQPTHYPHVTRTCHECVSARGAGRAGGQRRGGDAGRAQHARGRARGRQQVGGRAGAAGQHGPARRGAARGWPRELRFCEMHDCRCCRSGQLATAATTRTWLATKACGFAARACTMALTPRVVHGHARPPAQALMAVGDGSNDLHLVDNAGIGVAMANGVDPVRAAADWVAPSNDDHGVAAAIERFILQ